MRVKSRYLGMNAKVNWESDLLAKVQHSRPSVDRKERKLDRIIWEKKSTYRWAHQRRARRPKYKFHR